MAILKCKMCGGDLNIQDGMTVAECEYCGTRQTVPTADNEKKMTLFARANRLRAACEFDKAAGIYENIIAEFPEEAEAYWGLVLCKYGIEYVDDPATGKKIPTCHRSSFDSIMDDSDFEQVMENADPISRRVYRDEAKAIEELRKNIIEVSSKEEPYDIFICYKETDENGNRTVDSVIAQDIYKALTDEGYRVFFSRITLEDKLGQEYEPYIFSALNSAKVMLAVGTDYEYYNAVWVKNEWSRFLALIAKGEKKTLIPCYKDIDAYDIPKEFRRLQAQDMGKVGAMQDLLRGIGKIIKKPNALPEKDKRSGGPDLIRKVQLMTAANNRDYFPSQTPANNFDTATKYISIQTLLKNAIGYRGKITYCNRIYDNLNNIVDELSGEMEVQPDNDRYAVIWCPSGGNGSVISPGRYRIESWVNDSRTFDFYFTFFNPQNQDVICEPAEDSFHSEKNKRRNGANLIRTVMLFGAASDNDFFPKSQALNYVDVARFSYLSMQIILQRPIGFNGTATYNYKIYDSMNNLILDENRSIAVLPNYERFALIWILRGSDGSTVSPGPYRLETWINDSSVFEYNFQVIDSSKKYRETANSNGNSAYLQSLIQERSRLEEELKNTGGFFGARRKKEISARIDQINHQIKSMI